MESTAGLRSGFHSSSNRRIRCPETLLQLQQQHSAATRIGWMTPLVGSGSTPATLSCSSSRLGGFPPNTTPTKLRPGVRLSLPLGCCALRPSAGGLNVRAGSATRFQQVAACLVRPGTPARRCRISIRAAQRGGPSQNSEGDDLAKKDGDGAGAVSSNGTHAAESRSVGNPQASGVTGSPTAQGPSAASGGTPATSDVPAKVALSPQPNIDPVAISHGSAADSTPGLEAVAKPAWEPEQASGAASAPAGQGTAAGDNTPTPSAQAPGPVPPPPSGGVLETFIAGVAARLRELRDMLGGAVEGLVRQLDTWYTRLAFGLGVVCVLVTVVVNAVLVPAANLHVLPQWEQRAAVVLQREVSLGRIRWVGLEGLTGAAPLLRLGPVRLGPGRAERSHAVVPQLALFVEPLTSLVYRQAVLHLHLEAPRVSVVQGKNFSWFGYPDDTEDGARNFLPGLGSEEQGLAVGLEQASAFSQDRVAGSGSRGSQGPGGPPLASLAHAAVGVESAAPAAFAAGAALEAAQAALCECLLRLPVVDWVLQPLTGAASRRLAAAAMQQAVGRAGYTDSVAAHHVAGDTSTTVSPARGDELGGHSSACSPTAAREGFGGEGTAATSVALRGVHVSGIHLTGPCAAEATHDQASGGSSNGASQPWRLATARHNAVRPQCTPQRTGQSNPRWAASCGEPPLAAAMGVGGGPSGSIGAGAGSSAGSSSSLGPDPAVAAMLASEEAEVLPPVALGTVTVRNGSLNVYILGERLPRRLDYVTGSVVLGRAYRSLEVHAEADAHERPAASAKCTLINAAAKRHLRHVTPGAGAAAPLRSFGCDVLPGIVAADLQVQHVSPVSDLAALRPGPRRHQLPQRQREGRNSSHTRSTLPPPTVQPMGTGAASSGGSSDSAAHTPATAVVAGEDGLGPQPHWVCRYSETVRPQRSKFSRPEPGLPPETYTLRTYSVLLSREELERQEREHYGPGMLAGQHGRGDGAQAPAPGKAGPQERTDPLVQAATGAVEGAASGVVGGAAASSSRSGGRRQGRNQPTGGRLSLALTSRGMNLGPGLWPDLTVSIRGEALHGPLIERLLELPMDIHDGRVDGELRIRAYDAASWQFPELHGRIKCTGADVHFWDAPDDISGADMDLLLERGRMYLHGAAGRFGAVPITITGDMDLNPEMGTYRLQSNVPGEGVEINALRATLGVRPIPIPISGAIRGVLHVTGPLERPTFSGSAVAVRPSEGQLSCGLEATTALEAMAGCPGAVAGYDKVPLMGAQGVFTLDMATQVLNVHSVQVVPPGGGSLLGSGRMWLAPAAETDPRAISFAGEAKDLDADKLLQYYMPPDTELPEGVRLGHVSVQGSMSGSHVAPVVALNFDAPAARLTGSASFSQTAIAGSMRSPAFSLDGTLHTAVPFLERMRNSETQAEATYFAKPRFMGADLELHCAAPGADLLPLATGPTTAPPFDPLAANQPLHLRVAGHAKLSLRPTQHTTQQQVAAPGAGRLQEGQQDRGQPGEVLSPKRFEGSIALSGVRINSLDLVRQLAGTASIVVETGEGAQGGTVAVRARGTAAGASSSSAAGGLGAADVLDLQLGVPDLVKVLNLAASERAPAPVVYQPATANAAGGTPAVPLHVAPEPAISRSTAASKAAQAVQESERASAAAGGPGPSLKRPITAAVPPPAFEGADSSFLLRRGPLLLQAEVVNGGGEVFVEVANLQLDDLEAGSLRGVLSAASLAADVLGRRGRGSVSAEGLRLSSLAVGSFGGAVRWEGDIVKLEETVLEQRGSRYEVSGEIFLPGFGASGGAGFQGMSTPAASQREALLQQLARQTKREQLSDLEADPGSEDAEAVQTDCRWRVSINVPNAQISDLLPAVQLATSASRPGTDYGEAKARFLEAIQAGAASAVSPPDIRLQVDLFSSLWGSDGAPATAGKLGKVDKRKEPVGEPQGKGARDPAASHIAPPHAALGAAAGGGSAIPALSELTGCWSGKMQLYGGLSGANAIDFMLAGRDWRWGPDYRLDRLAATGSADSGEGVALEELAVDAGPARLRMSGTLLCARQDTRLTLSDFPLQQLEPLTRAMPVLEKAARAAKARSSGQGGLQPLAAGLGKRLDATLQNLGLKPPGSAGGPDGADGPVLPPAGGPLSGRLFVEGSLGGSVSRPQAAVQLRVEDGAVGGAMLGRAEARLSVDPQQRLHVAVDVAPRGGGLGLGALSSGTGQGGYVRLTGSAALPVAAGNGLESDSSSREQGPVQVQASLAAAGNDEQGPDAQSAVLSWPVPLDSVKSMGVAEATAAEVEGKHPSSPGATSSQPNVSATAESAPENNNESVAQQPQLPTLEAPVGPVTAANTPSDPEAASALTDLPVEEGAVRRGQEATSGFSSEVVDEEQVALRSQGFPPSSGPHMDEGHSQGQGAKATPTIQVGGPSPRARAVDTATSARAARGDSPPAHSHGAPAQAAQRFDGAVSTGQDWYGAASGTTTSEEHGSEQPDTEVAGVEECSLELHVRDGGMGLLLAMIPECEWQGGGAAIDLRVHGKLSAPQVEGSARISRGALLSPALRYPVTNLNADVMFDGSTLHARSVEASLGKTGVLRAHGALPVQPLPSPASAAASSPAAAGPAGSLSESARALGDALAAMRGAMGILPATRVDPGVSECESRSCATASGSGSNGVVLEVENAEVRARGVYSGLVDARLVLSRSLVRPTLGGKLRFSKGAAYLIPPAQVQQQDKVATSTAASATPVAGPLDTLAGAPQREAERAQQAELVRTSFALLKAGRKRAILTGTAWHSAAGGALALEDPANVLSGLGGTGGGGPPPPPLQLAGLEVALGPDLRAIFPVVLNLGLSGTVVVSGPADPQRVQPVGVISLDSGTLNLVATQFVLDRDHPNRIIFAPPEAPQDPTGAAAAATAAAAAATQAPAGVSVGGSSVLGASAVMAAAAPPGAPGSAEAGVAATTGPVDPLVDVVLVSGDLRAAIQGRSSAWQDGLSLTASGTPLLGGGPAASAGGGVGVTSNVDSLAAVGPGSSTVPASAGGVTGSGLAGGSNLSPSGAPYGGGGAYGEPGIGEAARVLEERLTDALLGEKGQLALRSLARSTVSSLLPRIETRGQVGHARWRLVGAPSLPSLLSLPDPVAQPSRFLSMLALGTEVEVAFGSRLQASLSHKLQELGRSSGEAGGAGGTEARLSLQLTSRLRLQAHLARGALLPSVTLQYSSETGAGTGLGSGHGVGSPWVESIGPNGQEETLTAVELGADGRVTGSPAGKGGD